MGLKKMLLGLALLGFATQAAGAEDQGASVAVLPFKNTSGDPTMAWLADAVSETLSTRLPVLAPVRVVERAQVEKLIKEIYFSQSALVDESNGIEAGKLMSAKFLVVGSYQLDAQALWLQARLVKVETGQVIAASEAKGLRDQVLELEALVADKLGQSLLQNFTGPPPAQSANLLPPSKLDFQDVQALERARGLLRDLPRYDLDPLRQRNQPKYFQALEYLEKVLAAHPDQIEALLASAQVYLNLDQADKALGYIQRAASLAPASAEPAYAMGNYYKISRNYAQALPALQQALIRNPRHAEAAYAAAAILHLMQRDNEALDYLFRALSSRPGLTAAQTLLETIVTGQIQNQPASGYLGAQAPNVPACGAALLWLGFQSQRPDLGQAYLARALATYPDFFGFYYHLGETARQKNQVELAHQMLEKSVSLYPVYPPAHLALGDLYFGLRNCPEASRHYKLYLHLANTGERFAELSQRIQSCEGSK